MVDIGFANDWSPTVPMKFGSPGKLLVELLNQGFQLSNTLSLLQGESHKFGDWCAKGTTGVLKLDVINRRFRTESRAGGSRYASVISLLGERIAGIFRDPVYPRNEAPLSQMTKRGREYRSPRTGWLGLRFRIQRKTLR